MTNKIRNPNSETRPVLRSRVECRRTFSSGEHSIGTCESGADTAEGGRKSETRSPKTQNGQFRFRVSGFLSDFDLRISDFQNGPRDWYRANVSSSSGRR